MLGSGLGFAFGIEVGRVFFFGVGTANWELNACAGSVVQSSKDQHIRSVGS